MRNSFSARFLVICTVLILVLAACNPNIQEQIIGEWKVEREVQNTVMVLSFKEDGSLTIWLDDVPIEGSYTWLDEDTLQMTMTMANASQDIISEVKIDGDQMIMSSEEGEIDVLTRVE